MLAHILEDVRLISTLLNLRGDGPVEIYLITFTDDTGRFYIGQHRLAEGQTEDPAYLGGGRRLNELPKEGRVKHQLLRVPADWANIIEELLVMKYRQTHKPLCLNASVGQTKFWQKDRGYMNGYYAGRRG